MNNKLVYPKFDLITLHAGQCLITGNGPEFTRKRLIDPSKNSNEGCNLESFGLFDIASPNFQTYYPDVKAEDLAPKDEDFIYPVFRAISEVIVRKGYDPIDFSQNGVIKASMNKLLGQAIMTNHEAKVGNELGAVSKTFWEEAYLVNNHPIPAGINAEFKIDGKSHPNIARKILMSPPAIHSNSVTLEFGWDKSHPKMADVEFAYKVGKLEKGELVRRIANEVRAYHETSLVSHGADPYAQIIRDGKINNPTYAQQRDSLSENDYKATKFFSFSYKESLAEPTIPSDNNISDLEDNSDNNKPKVKMNKSLVFLLASLAGITLAADVQTQTDEQFAESFDLEAFGAQLVANTATLQAIETATAEVARLSGELETANTEKATLQTTIDGSTDKVNLAEKVIADKKAEVLRLYSLSVDGKTNESITSKLEAADFSNLELFEANYKTQLEGKFPAKCKKCGSNEVSMGSASSEGEGNEDNKDKTVRNLSDVRGILKTKKVDLSNFNS